jgi:hypothetical protein
MNPVLVMEKGKGCKILDVRIGLWLCFIHKITILEFRLFIELRHN